MINISAHGAKSVTVSPIQTHNGTIWRTITIVSKDGIFKIDIFPDDSREQLAIIENPDR